jgi:VWFA-related protein
MKLFVCRFYLLMALVLLPAAQDAWAQPGIIAANTERGLHIDRRPAQGPAQPVTIPITVRWRDKSNQTEILDLSKLQVLEDGEQQEVVSVRAVGAGDPLYLAILIQDDVTAPIGNELKGLREFIQRLPPGSRVMVAYLRAGSLQVRQKFTNELDKAAKALRIPTGQAASAPFNPYVGALEALKRFDSQPKGRRAMLLVSDGVDIARGLNDSSPGQSIDLQRSVDSAQRRSVAVYSIYAPTSAVAGPRSSFLVTNGQGSLNRLSDETGGRAFFQGSGAPVSFDPFLKEVSTLFRSQLALTYLSTHLKKGFHRIKIIPGNRELIIEHPAGYTR